jgi:tRNA(Ile)-lysidine synthase
MAGGTPAAPLDEEAFAALVDPLGPFEPAPRIAVGVSGGADSLALALLLHRWARARGGSVLALTVDHGLRAEAAEEAAAVGRAMRDRGIDHEVLRAPGPAPTGGVQAWARRVRADLLLGRCRSGGVLHLALAHRLEDQAETLLMRLSRGSGPDGLAGMAAVSARGDARVLRPLLPVPRARLEATCRAAGLAWADDPSNADSRFARARLRAVAGALAGEGLSPASLAASALRAGRARAAADEATAALLARAAVVHPEGWLEIDPAPLLAAPEAVRLRAFAAALAAVGSAERPAREEAVLRALAAAASPGGGAAVLAGARVERRRGAVLVCRDPSAVLAALPIGPGAPASWDGRYRVLLEEPAGQGPVTLGALGRTGAVAHPRVPGVVRAGLPALRDGLGLLAVPPLGWVRPGEAVRARAVFVGRLPLSGAAFRPAPDVVCPAGVPIS